MARVDGAELGVAAAVGERRHLVAERPARNPLSEADDLARHFEAEKIGGAWRRRIKPFPLHEVGAVDAGGGDADQHLAGGGARHRAAAGLQHLRPAGGAHLDRGHVGRNGLHHLSRLRELVVVLCRAVVRPSRRRLRRLLKMRNGCALHNGPHAEEAKGPSRSTHND
jgi:hypothetical protein